MEEKLIDIITIGVIIYVIIMVSILIREHNERYKKLLENYKKHKLSVNIGLLIMIIIIITNIYYNLIYDRLSLDMKEKTIKLYNATITGIIALLIAGLAYLDKVLPAFFLIFIVHYYFSKDT